MLCNARGGGVRGQRDQGRSGLEAESRLCCQDVTKWDVRLQSRPFSQSGPIIRHVTKYLVNSICLNFQETQPKGSRERPMNKRWQQLNHGMYHYTSHREAVLVPVSMSHICILHFLCTVLLYCTTNWVYQQRDIWAVFLREGNLVCQVFADELITLYGASARAVFLCAGVVWDLMNHNKVRRTWLLSLDSDVATIRSTQRILH